jgi:hypothetical protein
MRSKVLLVQIVTALLQARADIEHSTEQGATALAMARAAGKERVSRLMLTTSWLSPIGVRRWRTQVVAIIERVLSARADAAAQALPPAKPAPRANSEGDACVLSTLARVCRMCCLRPTFLPAPFRLFASSIVLDQPPLDCARRHCPALQRTFSRAGGHKGRRS